MTPWTTACQASLSFTISQSLLKFMSTKSLMPSSPSYLSLSLYQGLFQWVSSSHQVAKVLGLQLQHPSFRSIFRIDRFDLLAVQGTLKRFLQHHNSKASTFWHSDFFMVQLSHLHMTTGKTIALTIQTSDGKVMSLLCNMLSRLVMTAVTVQWFWSPRK